MRGTVAKRLRKQAILLTVGQHPDITRVTYKSLKKQYKSKP